MEMNMVMSIIVVCFFSILLTTSFILNFCGRKPFFHIHLWKNNREVGLLDICPPYFLDYETPTRKCKICGKEQKWLPGYGGSELGCWTD